MKKLLFALFTLFTTMSYAQNVGIGTPTPAASAKLDITSTNSGLLIPRMTQGQRNTITTPIVNNSVTVGHNQPNNLFNQVLIGNASSVTIGGFQNWTIYSDSRMKFNVKEDVHGLDFINRLRLVTYNRSVDKANEILGMEKKDIQNFAQRLDVEKIRYTGFIAQEVEAAAKVSGYDFSGVKPCPA